MKNKKIKPEVWNIEDSVYYYCKKCHGLYLEENYSIDDYMCKKCLARKNKLKEEKLTK